MIALKTLVQFILPSLVILILVPFQVYTFKQEIAQLKTDFIEKSESQLDIFVSSIHSDLLEGKWDQVYSQCKLLFQKDIVLVHITDADGRVICDFKDVALEVATFPLAKKILFEPQGKVAANLNVKVDMSKHDALMKKQFFRYSLMIIALVVLQWLLIRFIGNYFTQSIDEIVESLTKGSLSSIETTSLRIMDSTYVQELSSLSSGLLSLVDKQRKFHIQVQAIDSSLATSKAFAQVTHDLKSPVSALNIALRDTGASFNQEKIQLLKMASMRINEIVNSISPTMGNWKKATQQVESTKISILLDGIVLEKSIEYTDRPVQINLVKNGLDQEPNFKASSSDLLRMLSNLLNNSIEATPSMTTPTINLTYSTTLEEWSLKISDNGKGVSKSLAYEIEHSDISIGKHSGFGLGMSHAKNFMHSMGGTLSIHALDEQGTEVILQAPYFLNSIPYT